MISKNRNHSAWELRFYFAAMNLCVVPGRFLARVDDFLRSRIGAGFLPRNWHVTERFLLGPRGGRTDGSGPAKGEATLWLHGASLGEAKGVWYLAAKCLGSVADSSRGDLGEPQSGAADRSERSRIRRIVVTANTGAGLRFLENASADFRRSREAAGRADAGEEIRAVMAPVDHPSAILPFISEYSVGALCLYEAELWPGWLRTCHARGIPAFLISAKLTRNAAVTLGRHGRAVGEVLSSLAWIQAQGMADAARFRGLGAENVSVGADFKVGYYLQARLQGLAFASPAISRPRLAFLSVHLEELKILLPAMPKLCARFDILMFPRHMRELRGFRKTLAGLGFGLHSQATDARHLLVDSLGRVGDFLPSCSAAFVGGSLAPIGAHNLWEPLLAGVITYFGPNYAPQEYPAEAMLERGLAKVIRTVKDAEEMVPGDAAIATACEALVRDSRIRMDAAWEEFRETIFATFGTGRGVAADPTGNGSSAS